MNYYNQFIFSFFSTVGFSVIFNVPKKSILYAGITGALGWTIYIHIEHITRSAVFSILIGSMIVGLLGEIFARIDKKPVTTFIIPGIVPLVPGYSMYLAMINLINQNFLEAVKAGTEAVFIGGAISAGIIIIASIARILKSNKRKKHKG